MKKHIVSFLAFVGLLCTACLPDNEFLTEVVKDRVTIANAFQSSDQIFNTILSGYYEYQELFYPNEMGMGITYDKSAGTDILDAKWSRGANGQISNFAAAWSTTSDIPKEFWDKFYKMISFSNLALSQMENVAWTNAEDKKRIEAEAYFLRGLSYLRLTELYGGVPLVLEYSETPSFAYERASRAASYQAAIDDLKLAYEGLPQNVSAEPGRAGKDAAALFLSEAYLALGVENNDNKSDFDQAAKYAQTVINNHPLMQNRFGVRIPSAQGSYHGVPNAFPEGNVYSDLFISQNVSSAENTEAIWVVQSAPNYAAFVANGGYRCCTLALSPSLRSRYWKPEYMEPGAAQGPWAKVSAEYGGVTYPPFTGGTGWAQFAPTWWVSYDAWQGPGNNDTSFDMRYVEDVTVQTSFLCADDGHSLYGQKVGWDHIQHDTPQHASVVFPFWYKESPFSIWDFDPGEGQNWFGTYAYYYRDRYVARSAEAFLLLAEAKFRAGDASGAKDAVNAIRNRAQAKPFDSVNLDIIMDERARELLYEEFRWATFLRLKPAEWKQRVYDHGMYCARSSVPESELFPNTRRWALHTGPVDFDLWPIPQTYIDLNKESEGMPQNPGWKE